MDKLLPCPFCGGPAEMSVTDPEDDCHVAGCPDCDFCLMGGPIGIGWYRTADDAITAWNRRT